MYRAGPGTDSGNVAACRSNVLSTELGACCQVRGAEGLGPGSVCPSLLSDLLCALDSFLLLFPLQYHHAWRAEGSRTWPPASWLDTSLPSGHEAILCFSVFIM